MNDIPRKPRRKLKYTIVVKDEGIPVCEIRFGSNDFANFIGEKLSEFLNIMNAMDVDSSRMPEEPFWAGNGFTHELSR